MRRACPISRRVSTSPTGRRCAGRSRNSAPDGHLAQPPGTRGLTFGWLLGEVLRRTYGTSLAEVVAQETALQDVYFGVPDSDLHRVATLENHSSMIDGPGADYATRLFVPRFNAREIRQAAIPAGGVICSARALARMYAGLIGAGLSGARRLPEARMTTATALQTDAVDVVLGRSVPKALGYVLGQPGSPMTSRRTAFGHPGHGGSIGFADPEYGLSFALTKNHLVLDANSTAHDSAHAIRAALGIPEAWRCVRSDVMRTRGPTRWATQCARLSAAEGGLQSVIRASRRIVAASSCCRARMNPNRW